MSAIDPTEPLASQAMPVADDPGELARKPWVTPRVIVSRAEHSAKTPNTSETTIGSLTYGPS
jgi:hypothetical protein